MESNKENLLIFLLSVYTPHRICHVCFSVREILSVSKESKSFISSTASLKTSICSVAANHVTFGVFCVVFCFSSNAVFVCFFLIYYLSVCPSGVSPPCLYSYSNKCSLTNKMGRGTRPALAPPAGLGWELTVPKLAVSK